MAKQTHKPQANPADFHDATEHRFDPDENGVCRICGWWNPNGNICPVCGEPWEKHGIMVVVEIVPILRQVHGQKWWLN